MLPTGAVGLQRHLMAVSVNEAPTGHLQLIQAVPMNPRHDHLN